MTYTPNNEERPRAKQIERPMTAGELNLAITTVCLKYLYFEGENYQTYTRILSALSPYNVAIGAPSEYLNPKTLNQLKQQIKFLIDTYSGRVRAAVGDEWQDEINGTLIVATLEMYRRMIAPYQDIVCKANGDVYKPIVVEQPVDEILATSDLKPDHLTKNTEPVKRTIGRPKKIKKDK